MQVGGRSPVSKKAESTPKKMAESMKSPDRNVNRYQHALSNSHINGQHIDWMLGLRDERLPTTVQKSKEKPGPTATNPPEVFYKQTESSKIKHSSQDVTTRILSEYDHLIKKTPKYEISRGLITFESGLRMSQPDMIEREKKWYVLPKKERNIFPKLLTKDAMKKLRNIEEDRDLEEARDGYLSYPNFSQKQLKQRNYNNLRHLIKGQSHFNTLLWQTSLRS